jgi:acyl-CoA reductase-like NAD-dependent aldehyde dehydrogenase
VPVAERAALCTRAIERMVADEARISRDITRMMGKPLQQARRELQTMAARARHMIAIAPEGLADTSLPGREGFERRIERVPLGVVFNMPAWNYPLLTCVNALVPAVLATPSCSSTARGPRFVASTLRKHFMKPGRRPGS